MTARNRGFPENNFQHWLNNARIDGDLDVSGDITQNGEPLSGGSQTFEKVELDIAHNTPSLVITGVEVTTLEAGDIVLGTGASFVSITEAWNGTTPTILLGIDAITASIGAGSLSAMDGGTGSGSPQEILWPALTDPNTIFNAPGAFRCGTACTIYATVSDGSGGDPESNQGAGKIVLFVSRASS